MVLDPMHILMQNRHLNFAVTVSATAAGLARQNYGDYKKYNGNAIGAKIAFFDIGNVNSSIPNKGYLTPPQDYYNGNNRVLVFHEFE